MHESAWPIGSGVLEAVYEEALTKEFIKQAVPFERQVSLDLFYDGEKLAKKYRDFVCYQKIILEVKAVKQIPTIFYKQLFELPKNHRV